MPDPDWRRHDGIPPVKSSMLCNTPMLFWYDAPALPAALHQLLPVKAPLVPKHGATSSREVRQLLAQELCAHLVIPWTWIHTAAGCAGGAQLV